MELWDVYDENRTKTGKIAVRGKGLPEGGYHIVVHVCVFNSRGEMLIQQRQPFKHGFPNLWDVSAGGSAIAGETSKQAAMREVREEIGLDIDLSNVRAKFSASFDEGFDDWYVVTKDADISALSLQYEEVQAVKWASRAEIQRLIDGGKFIPYFKSAVDMIFDTMDQYGFINERQR
mgnify:CR=1 FL=1